MLTRKIKEALVVVLISMCPVTRTAQVLQYEVTRRIATLPGRNAWYPAVWKIALTVFQHTFIILAPVVQTTDSARNHHPVDSVVWFVNTYPLDSDLFDG